MAVKRAGAVATALLVATAGCGNVGRAPETTRRALRRAQDAALTAGEGGMVARADAVTGAHVMIRDLAFHPSRTTVTLGEAVVWNNEDDVSHAVESLAFRSGPLARGESFRHVFDAAGTFGYRCAFHPDMRGEIVVQP